MALPGAPSVRSARRRRQTAARSLPLRPIAIALALAGIGAAAAAVLRERAGNRVTLTFASDIPGATSGGPDVDLAFFTDRLAFAAPSPPPPLGERRAIGGTITVERDLVPGRGVVRYRAAGCGTGYAFVHLGSNPPPLRLRSPMSLDGRVGEPIGFWCFGWRCAGFAPVAGAEVILMGGGEHGIELARTTTDADGRFELTGFDGTLDGLGLRVQATGFALAHEPYERAARGEVLAVTRGLSFRGEVLAPPGVDPTRLFVLARGLPGVQAQPHADGRFVLDHVPAGQSPRLLISGLGPLWTHAPARAVAGQPLRIEIVAAGIVRGRVVDAITRKPLADALVWCGEQETVRSDEQGHFELRHVLPGDVEVRAQWSPTGAGRRSAASFGRAQLRVAPGAAVEVADIEVSTP